MNRATGTIFIVTTTRLVLVCGDITLQDTAVVTAANSGLRGGGAPALNP